MGKVTVSVDLATMTVLEIQDEDDDLCHLFDGNPDVALCGKDISGHRFVGTNELEMCPACDEIDKLEDMWEA